VSAGGPWGGPPGPPRKRFRPRIGLFLWLGFLALVVLGVWALSYYFPMPLTGMDALNLVQLVGVLALVSSGLIYSRGVGGWRTARGLFLWLGVALVLVGGFSFRGELLTLGQRVRSAVIPGYPVKTGTHEMIVTESPGGSYLVYGKVNGTTVPFLIDTGASDIVLSPGDARRIGIDMDALSFDHVYETANGQGRGAPYQVASLQVGDIVFKDVSVSINDANMRTSLLGMSFLRRLKSFGFENHQLVLRW
jgi:aspartyl protease family protein